MRILLLSVMVSMIAGSVGLCQPSAREDNAPAPNGQVGQPKLPAPPERSEQIDQLRADMARLQQRLDQLAAPADGTATTSSARPLGAVPAGPQVAPLDALGADPAPSRPAVEMCVNVPADKTWPMLATWKNGLQIASKNDEFRIHVGGSLQFDAGWNGASQAVQFGSGGTGELQDGAYFRRARLRVDGTMYEHFDFVAEFDFANNVENDTSSSSSSTPIGSPSFSDVWVGVNDLPLIGTLRTGWVKEPIGFEHLTSSRFLNFMERPPGADSLSLRSPGVMLLNASPDQRLTWALGFFHVQNDNFGFGVGDGEYAETGRLTWLPWYEDDGCQLLHLGIGASHRHLDNDQVDIHGRPSVRTMPGVLEPSLAETGTIDGTTQEVVDVELVGVLGPWTLQSEYFTTWVHDAVIPNQPTVPLGTLFYQGAYVEVLYFLTGEHQRYSRQNAVFDRVIPKSNFNIWNDEHGCGAWQVGVRYAYLDLQNKGVNGATLNDIVLGLNWFLNPNLKVQWNFAVDHRESTPPGSDGWTYIFGACLALDF